MFYAPSPGAPVRAAKTLPADQQQAQGVFTLTHEYSVTGLICAFGFIVSDQAGCHTMLPTSGVSTWS